jgi:hypothetical protein
MNHILSRIVTRANSVSYFLDLLDLLGKECPQILMESDNMSKVSTGVTLWDEMYFANLSIVLNNHFIDSRNPRLLVLFTFEQCKAADELTQSYYST